MESTSSLEYVRPHSVLSSGPVGRHDSGRSSPLIVDGFHRLVANINDVLGPSSGIDSADVDVEELKSVMSAYESDEDEWSKYAFADHSRPYTRNLVDRGNEKSNLLILVWTPGRGSPIHDHANAHCVMRVLKGSLTETIYDWPCEDSNSTFPHSSSSTAMPSLPKGSPGISTALSVKRSTPYESGMVTYMSDTIGLHRIQNPNKTEIAVSLHLYTPPNAAKHGCHIFDALTGKRSHVDQCHFYSELGIRL